MSRFGAVAVLACLSVLLLCPGALADADPASDILLGQDVFYPYSPQVSSGLQARLNGVVAAAHRAHFPLKVALIATPVDLGAIPSFFGKPQPYAGFLDQEISFGGKPPLLVIMPGGYGDAGLPAAAASLVASLGKPATADGNGLAQAAIGVVPRIAAASGHRLGGTVAAPSSTEGGPPAALLAGLAVVCIALAAGIITWRHRAAAGPPVRRARGPARRR
jgi:hypothetical protein